MILKEKDLKEVKEEIQKMSKEQEEIKTDKGISYEEPTELTPNNVVYYSNTYKQLKALDAEGKWKTYAIRLKAQRFLRENCIEYVKKSESKDGVGHYICKPIKGYNSTTYYIKSLPNREFECSCQFHQRVVKKQEIPGLICSHVLALKLMLKIWNWNKRKDKELYPENYK